MTEASLKQKLVKQLARAFPKWVVMAHQEMGRHGVPDLSITGGTLHTVWLELKYAHPKLRSEGIQDITMTKLEAASWNAWYVIWFDTPLQQETLIVRPSVVFQGNWLQEFEARAQGIEQQVVIEFLRRIGFPNLREMITTREGVEWRL